MVRMRGREQLLLSFATRVRGRRKKISVHHGFQQPWPRTAHRSQLHLLPLQDTLLGQHVMFRAVARPLGAIIRVGGSRCRALHTVPCRSQHIDPAVWTAADAAGASSASASAAAAESMRLAAAARASAAAAASDAAQDPINPEEHARRQAAARGFTDTDEDDSFDEEKAYRDADSDPVRTAARRRLLQASLHFVQERGWSLEAIRMGAEKLGLSSAAHGLAEHAEADLVFEVMLQAQERARNAIRELQLEGQEVSPRNKLQRAIIARLEGILPYESIWPAGLALVMQPQHAGHALRALARDTDELWHLAGDQSSDLAWYSKRGILAGVYGATELFLLTDRSPGHEATWAFLRRRLDDAEQLAHLPAHVQSLVQYACNAGGFVVERMRRR